MATFSSSFSRLTLAQRNWICSRAPPESRQRFAHVRRTPNLSYADTPQQIRRPLPGTVGRQTVEART
jgi:hypothetical protein